MKILLKNTIYTLAILFSTILVAQNEALFEEANALYNNGKYQDAIDKYRTILDSGEHSAALYFNLANSHYKLNHIAPSIYYYEKALQLSPNDQEIKNNLAFAQNMTIDAIDVIPEAGFSKIIKNITNLTSFENWAKLSVALVFLFVILFLIYYFTYSGGKKRAAFIGSLMSLILMLITLSLAFKKFNFDKQDKPAIVFVQEAQVKSEPNLRSEEAFKLHEGTKVQILDTVNNWKKVKLTDGKTGWMSNEDIKEL
ncbi:MAG TPA: tetratricopeptide repeat protein [Flavobacteriaceae bacterium]|nr:tetratricopeptide repeat protein [Flavobacteriaceae bacterium]